MQLLSDIESVVPVLYPAMVAVCLAVAFLLGLTYWTWDRAEVILVLAVYFLLQAVVFAVLILSGTLPDIAIARQWLTVLRILMLVDLGAVIFWQIRRFGERNR